MKRFWDKVEKTETCWNWIGADRGNGYGCVKFKGKVWDAHRMSWFLTFGEIPKEMYVCHHCDNRKCVRPDHLFLGSPRMNVIDALNKGRIVSVYKQEKQPKGEASGRSKLTLTQVQAIRKAYREEKVSYRKLAKRYNTFFTNIGRIVREDGWK